MRLLNCVVDAWTKLLVGGSDFYLLIPWVLFFLGMIAPLAANICVLSILFACLNVAIAKFSFLALCKVPHRIILGLML